MNTESKLNESFYEDKKRNVDEKPILETEDSDEMPAKGVNRKFTEKWDIHMCISSEIFSNIITFTKEVGLDAVFRFGAKDLKIYVVSIENTHSVVVTIDKKEIPEYVVNLSNDDDIKDVYFDLSGIDTIDISDTYPIDMYVDTQFQRKVYILSGNEITYIKLSVMNTSGTSSSSTLSLYKTLYEKIQIFTKDELTQRIVINQNVLSDTISSISKKGSKKADENYIHLYCANKSMKFIYDNGERGSDILLPGSSLIICPVRDLKIALNIGYLNKLNKLDLKYQCDLWLYDNPFVISTKLGGGNIIVYYIMATILVDPD